jgi:hypothetical protein
MARARELTDLYRFRFAKQEPTEATILQELRCQVKVLKRRLGEMYVGRRLGVSYSDFMRNGTAWFGADVVEKYRSDIEKNLIRVGMIVAGFIGGDPFLFEMREEEISPVTNFCLIGTGAYAADPAMHARGQTRNTPLPEAIYNCYEAKRIGEISPFVGSQTRMLVVHPPDKDSHEHIRAEYVTASGEKFLRRLFKTHGPRPLRRNLDMPKGALGRAFFNFKEGY